MATPLAYKDFVPKLLKEEDNFSTLALTGDIIGPKYETFDVLVERANAWLSGGSGLAVLSAELVEIEGNHCPDDGHTDEDDDDDAALQSYIAFLSALRVWYVERAAAQRGAAPQQLAYVNVLPTRLESTPRAFGPKFQTLSESLDAFSERWKDGLAELPGRLVRAQTCVCRFSPRHCSIDPQRTFWLASDLSSLHCCHFFRLFYLLGDEHRRTQPAQLGFRDFPPAYSPCRGGGGGGGGRGGRASAPLPQQANEANNWLSTCDDLRLVNLQLLDHTLYFKCSRDMPGQEQRKLNNPHVVTSLKSTVYHTKVLRVFYLYEPGSAPPPPAAPALKLFHVPVLHCTAAHICNDLWGPHSFSAKYGKVLDKVRAWLTTDDLDGLAVETVLFTCNRLRARMSALDTHWESHGHAKSYQLHALLLYVRRAAPPADAKPVPRYFADSTSSCAIL